MKLDTDQTTFPLTGTLISASAEFTLVEADASLGKRMLAGTVGSAGGLCLWLLNRIEAVFAFALLGIAKSGKSIISFLSEKGSKWIDTHLVQPLNLYSLSTALYGRLASNRICNFATRDKIIQQEAEIRRKSAEVQNPLNMEKRKRKKTFSKPVNFQTNEDISNKKIQNLFSKTTIIKNPSSFSNFEIPSLVKMHPSPKNSEENGQASFLFSKNWRKISTFAALTVGVLITIYAIHRMGWPSSKLPSPIPDNFENLETKTWNIFSQPIAQNITLGTCPIVLEPLKKVVTKTWSAISQPIAQNVTLGTCPAVIQKTVQDNVKSASEMLSSVPKKGGSWNEKNFNILPSPIPNLASPSPSIASSSPTHSANSSSSSLLTKVSVISAPITFFWNCLPLWAQKEAKNLLKKYLIDEAKNKRHLLVAGATVAGGYVANKAREKFPEASAYASTAFYFCAQTTESCWEAVKPQISNAFSKAKEKFDSLLPVKPPEADLGGEAWSLPDKGENYFEEARKALPRGV